MNATQSISRQQLQGYGATRYQAQMLTKNLVPVTKQGKAYVYALSDVIVSTRDYLQRSQIKQTTRQILEAILQLLLKRLGNIVTVSFKQATDPEINKLAKQLIQAMSDTDSVLAELKATAATIKTKYNL